MATQQLESSKFFSDDAGAQTKMPRSFANWIFYSLVLMATCFSAWLAYSRHDLVAVCAVVLVAFGVFCGFRRGFVGVFASLISFCVAAYLAPGFGVACESFLSNQLGTAGVLNRVLAIGIAAVVCYAGLWLVFRALIGKPKSAFSFNKLAGALAGGAQAAAAVALFLGGYVLIAPPMTDANQADDEDRDAFVLIAKQLESSELCKWVQEHNPFDCFPELNKIDEIKRTVAQLKAPEKVKNLLHHPSLLELKAQPEFKSAIDGLLSDPEIVELFKTKQNFTPAAFGTLLQNEAVLQLLDQPGFLKIAREIIVADGTIVAQ